MGADERVFSVQKEAFPHLVVPDWIVPEKGESLPSYARRFAEAIDPGEPCIIGGASFGGMIATEMIPHLQVKACILVGSAKHPGELPPIISLIRPFEVITRLIPYRMMAPGAAVIRKLYGKRLSPAARIILSQVKHSPPVFFRWAVRALLKWQKNKGAVDERIFHIHGERDPLLKIRYVDPDEIVRNGGHVISLRNGEEVNRFIKNVMSGLNR